jgi:hypothetical protein
MLSTTSTLMLATTLSIGEVSPPDFAGRAEAQDQAVQAAVLLVALQQGVVAAPSYVYGLGPQGYGYYLVPAQQPVQQPQTPQATASRASSGTAPRRYREFGTGRSVPLAKPWLNQFK